MNHTFTGAKDEFQPSMKNGLLSRKIRKDRGTHKRGKLVRAVRAAVRAFTREWAR